MEVSLQILYETCETLNSCCCCSCLLYFVFFFFLGIPDFVFLCTLLKNGKNVSYLLLLHIEVSAPS